MISRALAAFDARSATGRRRVFKSLAGLDRDEPLTSFTIALYGLLFLVAMALLAAWVLGSSAEWPPRSVCLAAGSVRRLEQAAGLEHELRPGRRRR